jgi:hypothetical protein
MRRDIDQLYQDGVAAIRAGNPNKARSLLEEVVRLDPVHEQGWLWLSAVVETDEDRITCLDNVLTINPFNEEAQRALTSLGGSLDLDTNAAGAPVPLPPDPHHKPKPPPKLEHGTAPAVESLFTKSGAALKQTATGKEAATTSTPSRSQIIYGLMALGMLVILALAVVVILTNS